MSGASITRRKAGEQGESRSDWERVDRMSEEELEAAIASDPDWQGEDDWSKAELVIPVAQRDQWLRLDPDLAAWFHAQGPEAEARMRAILRAAMEAAKTG